MAQVIVLGPWSGDSLQQRSQQWAAIQQLQGRGAVFQKDVNQAHKLADARKWMIYSIPPAPAPGETKWLYAIVDGTGTTAGGGSGSGSGGTGAGAGAPSAVQAGGTGTGAGGPHFQTAAGLQTSFVPERNGTFLGLDTFNPPDKLNPDYSPDAVNWDGFRKFGSRCNRAGTAKLSDDIYTVTYTLASMTCVANSDLTASTDYIIFTLPDTTTHAFWFDTTGADSEPAGSVAATASTQVTTTALTAAQVATAIASAINTAAIGLVANATGTGVWCFAVVGGATWTLTENVTNAGFTVVAFANTTLDSDYGGLSIARIPGNGSASDQLLLCFADNDIGSTPTFWPTSLHVVTPTPTWGIAMPIIGCPGPTLSLAQISGPKVRATVEHGWPGTGQRNNSVRQVVVRYSLRAFPADIDGRDSTESVVFASADRAAWTGVSATKDTTETFSVADVVYVSAWTVTLEGWSKPSHQRITIT